MSFAVVYRKECLDNFRDRRALISSLSLAVLGPALFIGLMGFMLNTAISEQSDPVPLTVLGARYAPALIDHLEANNAKLKTIEAGNPAGARGCGRRGTDSHDPRRLRRSIPRGPTADADAALRQCQVRRFQPELCPGPGAGCTATAGLSAPSACRCGASTRRW